MERQPRSTSMSTQAHARQLDQEGRAFLRKEGAGGEGSRTFWSGNGGGLNSKENSATVAVIGNVRERESGPPPVGKKQEV